MIQGDCNEVLPNQVFPKVEFKDYRRALCVLDPYGMHLNWKVTETAGRMKSVYILMNFPIMDMNLNALRLRPDRVTVEAETRMTAFWGDESWKQVAYKRQQQFFGEDDQIKLGNEEIVGGVCQTAEGSWRLRVRSETAPNEELDGFYRLLPVLWEPEACGVKRL